jgi:hypothetical protein
MRLSGHASSERSYLGYKNIALVRRMSVFEYLGVLLSVIMGLGVTHILVGLSKTIHHRKTSTLFWVHSLWAINVLIYIVIIWWGMFWWSGLQEWSFFQFLLLVLYAIVLFFAASLLFPWDLPDDFNFEAHFFDTRPWFFSVLAVAWCIDIPETVLKSTGGLRDLPEAYVALVIANLALFILAMFWSNQTYHKAFAVVWPVYTIGYLSITTLAQIAT